MYDLAGKNELDLEALRTRLRRMRQGPAPLRKVRTLHVYARGDLGKEPRKAFVIQLREAVEEWGVATRLGCGKGTRIRGRLNFLEVH
jgi:hypothetical protein